MIQDFFYRQKNIDDLTETQHSHINQIEIIFIVSGTGNITIGKKCYKFKSGSLFLFDGSIPHYVLPDNGEDYIRNKLMLNKSMLSLITKKSGFDVLHYNSDTVACKKINESFKKLNDVLKDGGQIFLINSLIFELLSTCYLHNYDTIPSAKNTVESIMKYITENLKYDLTIEQIANHFHISKYHMCRKFKNQTGTTIHCYIRRQRIYLSKKLLEETSKPVTDIALEAGFADISYFTKAFKAETELTPSQYRKNVKRDEF